MTRVSQIFHFGPYLSVAARVAVRAAGLVLFAGLAAHSAFGQIQFPGPTSVEMADEALCAVSLPLEDGNPEFLVSGLGNGRLVLHRYSPGADRLLQISQTQIGGRVVGLIRWEGRPLQSQGIVAATVNPDRLVFLQVLPQAAPLHRGGLGGPGRGPRHRFLPGRTCRAVPANWRCPCRGSTRWPFSEQEAEVWNLASVQDAGDDPQSILGIDLDGDQVRELVTANRGPLSGNLGVFRRNPDDGYEVTMQDFAAGTPSVVTGFDLDEDGRLELAALVKDSPQVVLLSEAAGQLVPFDTIGLTLPAEGLHLTRLFDGTVGLFTSNRQRGLVDFFQLLAGRLGHEKIPISRGAFRWVSLPVISMVTVAGI